MKLNILIGGKAGQGPNFLADLLSKILVEYGLYVFNSRDYQSLIRGGHNFNHLTISDESVFSNSSKIDILVALDENTLKIHKKELNKSNIILEGSTNNAFHAGCLFKILGLDIKLLEREFRNLGKRIEENIDQSKKGYDKQKQYIDLQQKKSKSLSFLSTGSQAVSSSAISSGLNFYYAYPMTPATPLLTHLSQQQLIKENNHKTIQLENEIAVINAAIGSSITGALSMVGTSGGGFDLMTEALSLTGIAEIPLVLYLAQRPGPGTGSPTYTSQGDLNIALYSGHGEFQRIVLAPGDPEDCIKLTNKAFELSQKYKIPAILLSDKHLAESEYTLSSISRIRRIKSLTKLRKYNSYESDEAGSFTEDPSIIRKNIERRLAKARRLQQQINELEAYKTFGKKESKNLIISWGSTKGAILDSIKDIDCKFIQILYLEPFSESLIKEIKKYKPENILVIENNSTSPLSKLIEQKTQIKISEKNKILKYDTRPFFSDELNEEIRKRIKC